MSVKIDKLKHALTAEFGGKLVALSEALGELTLELKAQDYRAAAQVLHDMPALGFKQLTDLCGVDYSQYGEGRTNGPRFAVVGHGGGVDSLADEEDGLVSLPYEFEHFGAEISG